MILTGLMPRDEDDVVDDDGAGAFRRLLLLILVCAGTTDIPTTFSHLVDAGDDNVDEVTTRSVSRTSQFDRSPSLLTTMLVVLGCCF